MWGGGVSEVNLPPNRIRVRGMGYHAPMPPSLMGSLNRNTEEVTAIYNRLVKLSPM